MRPGPAKRFISTRIVETPSTLAGAPARIRVLVADDHPLMRIGLVSLLEQDPLLTVVGQAQDGREAVSLAQALEPHVVLMDVGMPAMDGLEATRVLRERCPRTSILILTVMDDEALLREAVDAGAAGFLLKTASGEQLCQAVRDVAIGTFPIDRGMLQLVLANQMDESDADLTPMVTTTEVLTRREREVLALIARGMTNREIAETLIITTYTAKAHVEHIFKKLGVTDRTQAAVRAMELGYVSQTANAD